MLAIMKRHSRPGGKLLRLHPGAASSSGMACNVLKAFFMAGMLAAVWWALENRDRLDAQESPCSASASSS